MAKTIGKHPMAGRRPWIRLDGAEVAKATEGDYPIAVTIHGHNLKMAISPPRIEIGGVPLENISFEDGGKTIRGILSRMPEDDRVLVDYGFANDETKANWKR